MSRTIAALYKNRKRAEQAVSDLLDRGVPAERISVLSHQEIEQRTDLDEPSGKTKPHGDDDSDGAGKGAAKGAAAGGVGGVLVSLGLAALPGIGWVLAAGPVGSMVATGAIGAGVGAVAGGIAGGMEESGVERRDANLFAEAVRRGGTVLLLTVSEANAKRIARILDRHDPIDIDRTAERYRSEGWTGFDPADAPYSRDEALSERERMEQESARTATPSPSAGSTADQDHGHVRVYVVETPVDQEIEIRDDDLGERGERRGEHRHESHLGTWGKG